MYYLSCENFWNSINVLAEQGPEDRVPNMPKFVKKLQSVKVKNVGDSVTLTCQVGTLLHTCSVLGVATDASYP